MRKCMTRSINMTVQMKDQVLYEKNKYLLLATTNEYIKFDPVEYGIETKMIDTSCWAGFYSTYSIKEDTLLLKQVVVNSKNGFYPEINGKKAAPQKNRFQKPVEKEEYDGPYQYELDMPLKFTGKLLLGKGFIQEPYLLRGPRKIWKYENLIELQFEDGKLVNKTDLSGDTKYRYK